MRSKAMFIAGAAMLAVGMFLSGMAAGSAAEASSATSVTLTYLTTRAPGQPNPCGVVSGSGAKVSDLSATQTPNVIKCKATFKVLR